MSMCARIRPHVCANQAQISLWPPSPCPLIDLPHMRVDVHPAKLTLISTLISLSPCLHLARTMPSSRTHLNPNLPGSHFAPHTGAGWCACHLVTEGGASGAAVLFCACMQL